MTTNNNDIKKEVLGITLKDSKNNKLSTENTSLGISPNHTQTNSDDINVANNVAQRNSQDLTEQWKKGELEDSEYYIKSNKGDVYIDIYAGGSFMFTNYRSVEEILAPVPDYEKWKSLNEILDSSLQTNKALAHRLNLCKDLLKEWIHYYPIVLYEHEDTLKTKDIIELYDRTREVIK